MTPDYRKQRDDQILKDFKSGKITRRSDPRGDRGNEFLLSWARWIWGMYANNGCQFGYGGKISGRSIAELRLYARGRQSTEKYRDQIDPKNKKGKRLMNISFDNYMVLPNLRGVVKEMIHEINLDADIEAVDVGSKKKKGEKIAKMKLATMPQVQGLMQMSGMNPEEVIPPGVETEIDVEVLDRLGGVKVIEEIEIKDCIDRTMNRSGFDVTKDMIADDVVDNFFGACHIRKVPDKLLQIEYVDLEKLILPVSRYPDFRDAQWGGFWQSLSLAELRERGMPEEDIVKVAKTARSWNKYNGGDFTNDVVREEFFKKAGHYQYDYFKADVLTCYFMCDTAEKYITGIHEDGNLIYDKVSMDAKLDRKDRQKRSFEETKRRVLYQVNWVIGTDVLYKSGENTDNVVDDEGTPIIPIIAVAGDGPSPVEKAISIVDDIHMDIYKERHIIQKMTPGPRFWFNKSMIRDQVTFGNEKFSQKEMMAQYVANGIGYFETVMDYEDPSQASHASPIIPVGTGIQEDIQILRGRIMSKLNELRDVMGVNEVSDGTNKDPRMLKGVMEGLKESSNIVNRPYVRLMMSLYRRIIQYIGYFWQNSIVYDNLGEEYPEAMRARLKEAKFEYQVKFGLTEFRKQMLLERLAVANQKGEMLDDAFLVVSNMINRGDIAKAELYMVKAQRDAKKEAARNQQAAIQAQNEGAAQAVQMKEQGLNERLAAELDTKKVLPDIEADADIKVANATQTQQRKD